MGMTLEQLRVKLRRSLGVDSDDSGFDDADVDLFLNTSWWEIADIFKFKEKETDFSEDTAIGVNEVAVQSDLNGLQLISITDLYSDQHTPLIEISLRDYETNYVDRTEARGKPTHYFRRNGNIILWPTPDQVYEIKTYYWKTLADIAAGGPDIPHNWDEVILAGGIWRGAAELGDANRKRMWKETQMELLGTKETDDVKDKTNRPYAGLQMMRPPYP